LWLGSISQLVYPATDVRFWADICLAPPAAMGSSPPIMLTNHAGKNDEIDGQIECKQLVNCNANECSVPMQSGAQVD
jgi:hypothetical protein